MLFLSLLTNPVTAAILLIPLGLIALDLLTGILSALKTGTFHLKSVSDFMTNDLEKYLVLSVICYLVYLKNGTDVAFTASTSLGMGTLALSTIHSIIQNIGEIGHLNPIETAVLEQGADDWINSSTQKPLTPIQTPIRTSTPQIQTQSQYAYQTATGNYNVPNQKTPPSSPGAFTQASYAPTNGTNAYLTAPAQPSQPPVYQSPMDFTQVATVSVPAIQSTSLPTGL